MRATFNRLAAQELVAAAQYLQAEAHLGGAVLDEYEAWETRVLRFPGSSPEIAPGIRCGFLKRFKDHVTYTLRGDTLRILYVRHARQEPLTSWSRG